MAEPAGVDVHAHFFPESFIRIIEESGGTFGASVDRSNPKGPVLVVGSARTAPLDARYWDLDLRLRAMNRQGVATQDLSRALAELERAAALPGIHGVYMGTNVGGRELSDPEFFPIFERAAALRLPVLLHPLRVVGGERLAPYYLANFLGNPFDTAIAAAHLVFGGVLDRLPKLTVCLAHAGGALPYVHGRLRHGQGVRPETKGVAKRPFSAYLRRFTYDIISHDPAALRYLIAAVGADRVMLGTDFCFDMGVERPLAVIQAKAVGLGRRDQQRVIRENAARMLRLE